MADDSDSGQEDTGETNTGESAPVRKPIPPGTITVEATEGIVPKDMEAVKKEIERRYKEQ